MRHSYVPVHSQELDGLKSLHAREAEKSREALKAQEHHSKDLQQRMYTQARRHEAALKVGVDC